MTDKDKLEKVRKYAITYRDKAKVNAQNAQEENDYNSYLQFTQAVADYERILSFVDSMQEEPVSEDFRTALEEKVRKAQHWTYIEEEGCECPIYMEFGADDLEDFAKWGAEWQKQKDANLIFNAKEDGYRLGLATMKQQMMKDATWMVISVFKNGRGWQLFRGGYKIDEEDLTEREREWLESWVFAAYNRGLFQKRIKE